MKSYTPPISLTLTIFLSLFSLFVSAQSRTMVGGTCIYETSVAPLNVSEDEKERRGHFLATEISDISFVIKEPMPPSIYPASFSKITTGSCSPTYYTLLSTPEYSRPFFVEMNQGDFSTETEGKLQEIASTFGTVKSEWPNLEISLCGAPDRKYPESYRFELKTRYERQVTTKLVNLGVEESQIKRELNNECSTAMKVFTESNDGIWIKFILTPKTLNKVNSRFSTLRFKVNLNNKEKS